MIRLRGCAASLAAGLGALLFLCGSASAQEEEESKPSPQLQIRSYDHFDYDTTTGAYFGIATFYTKDNSVGFESAGVDTDVEAVTGEFRLAYGGEKAEFGVMIPYHFTSGNALGDGENDVGDIRTYLKAIPLRNDFVDAGGGLELIFPAGSEMDGTSTGTVGVLPFVTATGHAGPVDIGFHFGYDFINKHRAAGSSESLLYGGSVKIPIIERIGARLEVVGQKFVNGEDRNVAAIQPGFDFLVPIRGRFGVLLSVAGSYTFTGGTAGERGGNSSRWGLNTNAGLSRGEWGMGGAVGLVFN